MVMAPLRVLVVEDDAIIAELFEELLGLMGHQVCASAATEAEAIDAAARCNPDLIIVDERLGKGSGASE
jgi:CheY-like chemotaxis protein